MSNADAPASAKPSLPPLSWPPPGLERLQGRLWRVIGVGWIGGLILVLPLLWELSVEQPFWSLGPFEGEWQVGTAIAGVGSLILLAAFASFADLMRQGAKAAGAGFGSLTIVEVLTDVGRDMGFLIQGKRHFGLVGPRKRAVLVRDRLRGAAFVLAAALWLPVGFGFAVLLAARGFVTPLGSLLLTLGPSAVLLVAGLATLLHQYFQVRTVQSAWLLQEGVSKVQQEAGAWIGRLQASDESVALGSGRTGQGARFHAWAVGVTLLFIVTLIPTVTVAITASIGPILADIAVPTFLSVQEMAGAAETLRRYQLSPEEPATPSQAGQALQNIAFVGGGQPEPWEQAPGRAYGTGWFPDPDDFPDPYSEAVARDLMVRPLSSFSAAEQAALRQAAEHPAHEEFHVLARTQLVDVVSGRWTRPFPDTMTFQALPWPRFAAFRTAGLAQVAKAAVEVADGRRDQAEETLRELISTGFLLVDQGPTLIDNLMGVVLANMGGDALEGYYERVDRSADAQALAWARQSARDAARKARAGLVAEDIHSLLQGIPDLVEDSDALRGLRWEYFATFNTLAPCINVHKMVFGPDETYDEWRARARDGLVRVRGEVELFELAEGNAFNRGAGGDVEGLLPRFLALTLGSGGSPGSCASLVAKLEAGGGL